MATRAMMILMAVISGGCTVDAEPREAPGVTDGDRGGCEGVGRPLTFVHQIRTKMFIDEIKPVPGACDPISVIGPPKSAGTVDMNIWKARLAAYVAFCESTNYTMWDKPADGALRNPLDARIYSNVGVAFTCEPGNKTPTWANVTELGRAGGKELRVFQGVANPIAIANEITTTGKYAFVASGSPSPKLEFSFAAHRTRPNTAIWHRWAGSIECITDPSGNVAGARLGGRFSAASPFPTHRAYWWATDRTGKERELRPLSTIAQGFFSQLWHLPPTPAVGKP